MARFRLKAAHYLSVPDNFWERVEVNLQTGKQGRQRVLVPLYLNPEEGEVIVSTKQSRQYPNDIVFTGPVTPDMEPLDDEAEEMMANYIAGYRGEHPIESLPGTLGESLIEKFTNQLERIQVSNHPSSEIDSLKAQVAEQSRQISALMAMLQDRSPVAAETPPLKPSPPSAAHRRA
jgi:hypothetical protein